MQALLTKLRGALTRGGESGGIDASHSDGRLDHIVARQRGLRAASAQDRLSRQQTDPHEEDAAAPLYDESVYISGGPPSEEDPTA